MPEANTGNADNESVGAYTSQLVAVWVLEIIDLNIKASDSSIRQFNKQSPTLPTWLLRLVMDTPGSLPLE